VSARSDSHAQPIQSGQQIEIAVLLALLAAGAFVLFGPKSSKSSHEATQEEHAPAALDSAKGAAAAPRGSARNPLLAASVFSPQAREELRMVQVARRALSQGNPETALTNLKGYEAKFGNGRLADDVTLLRMEAHLKQGDREMAAKLANALAAKDKTSRQARRAKRLLSMPAPGTPPSKPAAR
jgi:hypothetical protein